MKSLIGFAIAMLALISTPAFAQQTPTKKVGIVMGSSATIGILWHGSENMALRPEVSIAKATNETTNSTSVGSTSTSTINSWSTGVGGSLLFYTGKWDNLRTYVSPRLFYNHTKSDTSSTISSSSKSSNYSASGSVGAQYALGTRFAVFGEVGLAYSWSPETSNSLSTTKSSGHAFGTRSTFGGVLYF